MISNLPVLEEKIKDIFIDTLLGLHALNPKEQPLKTIRGIWMPEIRMENRIYVNCIENFAYSIMGKVCDYEKSQRRAMDSLVLGYKILKEQSVNDKTKMPVVSAETFEKVNREFPFDESDLEILISAIQPENLVYWDYLKSTLSTYVEDEFVRENTYSFAAFCYSLLREQAIKDASK